MVDTRALTRRITPGGYKHDDIVTFVDALRERQVTCMPPSIRRDGRAPLTVGPASVDQCTDTQTGRRDLRLVEDVGLLRQVKLRGVPRVGWRFTFAAAAYNLVHPESGDGGDMSSDALSALASARTSAPS
ncbi:MAG TPA: hypothetical protein VFU48_04295 [Nitrospira sp.]|nr:hypothetical protein [Nitrospira sp.]